MEAKAPKICRVREVEVGSLFVLFGGNKGNPICLRATYDLPDDEDEANRVIPIHWPEDPGSVGVAIYASALNGYAIVLEDARLDVDPLSAKSLEVASLTAVYGKDGRLFFPVSYNGNLQGLVDVESGEILSSTSGSYIAFEDWQITLADDPLARRVILPEPQVEDP